MVLQPIVQTVSVDQLDALLIQVLIVPNLLVREETPPQEAEDVDDCPQEEEDKEDCPICTDALPKLSYQFTRLQCCGKGLHIKCAKDLQKLLVCVDLHSLEVLLYE